VSHAGCVNVICAHALACHLQLAARHQTAGKLTHLHVVLLLLLLLLFNAPQVPTPAPYGVSHIQHLQLLLGSC
jgi:hypothetical protein